VIHELQKVTESSKAILMEIRESGHTPVYLRVSRLSVSLGKSLEVRYGGKAISLDGGIIRNLGSITTTEQLLKRIDVLKEMTKAQMCLINDPSSMLLARDKLASLIELNKAGIPIPETTVIEDPKEILPLVERWGEVVIKPLMGSLGLGIVKVGDPDIAFRIAKSVLSINQPVYVQRYVRKPNRDIRVITVGDRVLGSIYRINSTNWKTNIARGATSQLLVPPKELEEIAIKAAKSLRLDYAGLDIVEDENLGYAVLEVNAAPLWKGFMAATNINPAKYIVQHLISKLRR
jgi:RimK family alpha-L-glutamate ligase